MSVLGESKKNKVIDRKMIAFRPDIEVSEYILKMRKINPDLSKNQIVQSLCEYAMRSLKGKATLVKIQYEIED